MKPTVINTSIVKILAFLLLAGSLNADAQTKWYLSSTASAAISPTVGATSITWVDVSQADRRAMATTKDGSAMTSITIAAANQNSFCRRQYISEGYAATTISSGTAISGRMRAQVSAVSGSARCIVAVNLYVVSNDGTTVRGQLFESLGGFGTDLTATLTNRSLTNGSVTNQVANTVVIQDGDRIVLEIGTKEYAANTARTVTESFGSNSATDLAADETTTAANNPWFQINTTLTPFTPTAKTRRVRVIN